MITDPASLTSTLEEWLDDGDVLTETRRFLKSGSRSGRSGLGDGQIANWRRRGLPSSFVEGAALYHFGQARRVRGVDPSQEVGIEGDAFWQVFIVHDAANNRQEWLDCTILRQWQGVRSLHPGDTTWLTHPAYRSTGKNRTNDEPETDDGKNGKNGKAEEEEKDKTSVESLLEGDPRFRKVQDDDGTVVVSWEIDRESLDYGYIAHFPMAIRNDHVEAVGGCPSIPIRSANLLAFLPRKYFDERQMRLPSNPRGIPGAFATLLNGDPVRVMESYLGIHKEDGAKISAAGPTEDRTQKPSVTKRDFSHHFRRLGPWFHEVSNVEAGFGSRRPPPSIRTHDFFKEAERIAQEGGYRAFATHVDVPRPFLTYFMVFGSSPNDRSGAGARQTPPLDDQVSSG